MRDNPRFVLLPARSKVLATLIWTALAALLALPGAAFAAAGGPFGPLAQQGPKTGAEPAPVIHPVGTQHTPAESAARIQITGEHLASLKAGPLPKGSFAVKQVSESEWEITGTPTTEKEEVEVTVSAQNAEKAPAVSEKFKWVIGEAAPTMSNPGPQHSVEGTAITPVVVTGSHLANVSAKELPEGLSLEKKSETEWQIKGTPSKTTKGPVTVTLKGENAEKAAVEQSFEWSVSEAPSTLEKPPDQHSVAGKAIVPVIVKGTHLASVTAPLGLPAGLELVKRSETEWQITGTPTTPKAASEVALGAQNKEASPVATTSFKWTVAEVGPTIEKPADQTSVERSAIAPVIVKGAALATLTAKGLPAGLELRQLSEAEWEISGTPATHQRPTEVTLEAQNKEGASVTTSFTWTVGAAAPPTGPAPTGALAVTPTVVFSASRASCSGLHWPVTAVATQWLLDGAPIAGATTGTYVPPRTDDGHSLACRQTATAANGVSTTVTSAARVVYEQPPQPAWPIVAAVQRCRTAICMFDGGTKPVQSAQSYSQGGVWMAARQVRCASAPWTSQAGDSALAAIHGLAAAHELRVSLQRVTGAGAVTIASVRSGPLPAGPSGGPNGTFVVPTGTLAFAAGEMWAKLYSSAAGSPNWFAAGAGALFYTGGGGSGVSRSFQLVYNLTPADLGATLRCVVGADDGPLGTPTRASAVSPEYSVSSRSTCGPRRLAPAHAPQPALVEPGRTACLRAPAGPAALEGSQATIGVTKGHAAIALACALRSCRGTLTLAAGRVTAGHAALRLRRGGTAVVRLLLTGPGRRLLARGSVVTVTLKLGGGTRLSLGTARLLRLG